MFWEQSFFDSDQAVIGLMAKHLSQLRAFPLFMYGQSYILAVEAWMAAPVFLVAGVSVAALKLPLLAINVAIAWLLVWILERDMGLRPALGGTAAIFFVLAPPGTAARFLEPSGGNVEPLLYVLLLWLTRERPAWFGWLLALGFFHREFTAYAVVAIAIIAAANGTLFTRSALRSTLVASWSVIEVWIAIAILKQFSSAAGPGTSIGVVQRPSNLHELLGRFCFEARSIPAGFQTLVTGHWPQLFGTAVQPVLQLGIDSRVSQGLSGSWVLVAAAMLVAAGRIATRVAVERRIRREHLFCVYLTLVGLISAGVFAIGRCGGVAPFRYDLLSVYAAVGISGWYLTLEDSPKMRAVWLVLVAGWVSVSILAHGRLLAEYVTDPPYGVKRQIVRELEARGIRYGSSDYWIAYYVTFLTNERILLTPDDISRILTYESVVEAHQREAVRVARGPCPGGTQVLAGVYFCPR